MGPLTIAFMLLGIAIGLALLDLIIPSHGLLVFSAFILAIVAIVFGFQAGTTQGLLLIALVGLLTPTLAFVMIKWWPHTPIGKLVFLSQPSEEEVLPDTDAELRELIGHLGRAKTDLLPNGAILLGGRAWDALTDGKAIDAGTPVKVVDVRTGRLVVRPAKPADLASAATPVDEDAVLAQPIEDWDLDDDDSSATG